MTGGGNKVRWVPPPHLSQFKLFQFHCTSGNCSDGSENPADRHAFGSRFASDWGHQFCFLKVGTTGKKSSLFRGIECWIFYYSPVLVYRSQEKSLNLSDPRMLFYMNILWTSFQWENNVWWWWWCNKFIVLVKILYSTWFAPLCRWRTMQMYSEESRKCPMFDILFWHLTSKASIMR